MEQLKIKDMNYDDFIKKMSDRKNIVVKNEVGNTVMLERRGNHIKVTEFLGGNKVKVIIFDSNGEVFRF